MKFIVLEVYDADFQKENVIINIEFIMMIGSRVKMSYEKSRYVELKMTDGTELCITPDSYSKLKSHINVD